MAPSLLPSFLPSALKVALRVAWVFALLTLPGAPAHAQAASPIPTEARAAATAATLPTGDDPVQACMSDPARSDELARFDRQEIDAYQAATGAREVPEALAVIARRVAAASPLLAGLPIRLVGYHAAWPNARAAAHGDVMLADALWSGPFRLDEDEAAALLAHELAHVELRHALHMACSALAANPDPAEGLALSLRRLQVTVTRNQASPAGRALLAVMREREAEADRRGQALMLEAGYSPHGLVTLLVKMNGLQAQVQAATHGESAERAEAARQRLVTR